ncbi:MAG: hypothetical protein NAOJABEB_00060 [Steroidobacteraceae bacterium]|nr:hypothetical protein [Steroidobacteraceae bacterium]
MTLSMYQASVPRLVAILENLSAILDKAQAHIDARKVDVAVLMGARLALDMYPFSKKEVVLPVAGHETRYTGLQLLLGHSMPNVYFHVTTAYNILRHNGVAIGKRDFLGQP